MGRRGGRRGRWATPSVSADASPHQLASLAPAGWPTAGWWCAWPAGRRGAAGILLVLACVAGSAPTLASGAGTYDPCAAQPSVAASDGFTLGIAYYPGGAASDWASLHPCLYADRAALGSKGVASMVFRPEVDKMSFFRGSPDDETALFNAAAGSARVMTVVAYAGNGSAVVRSDPRVVRASAGASTMARVNQLTLIARFDKGSLQYLQWHDMGCGDCMNGDACVEVGDGHSACAGTEAACTCQGANCALDLTSSDSLRCHLTIATAFSGTDKHAVPLSSAAQIERLGRYSATKAAGGAGAAALANAKALRDAATGK